MLGRLRALRLWHWNEAMRQRRRTKGAKRAGEHTDESRRFDQRAGQHIKFVQTLNDFFPVGDNAEQDAKRG